MVFFRTLLFSMAMILVVNSCKVAPEQSTTHSADGQQTCFENPGPGEVRAVLSNPAAFMPNRNGSLPSFHYSLEAEQRLKKEYPNHDSSELQWAARSCLPPLWDMNVPDFTKSFETTLQNWLANSQEFRTKSIVQEVILLFGTKAAIAAKIASRDNPGPALAALQEIDRLFSGIVHSPQALSAGGLAVLVQSTVTWAGTMTGGIAGGASAALPGGQIILGVVAIANAPGLIVEGLKGQREAETSRLIDLERQLS